MPKITKNKGFSTYNVVAHLAEDDAEKTSSVEIARRFAKNKAGIDASASNVTRQNNAYQNALTNKYFNYYVGFCPDGTSAIPTTEVIRLCQLAYFNNGTVGNVIDIMQEFSVANIDYISTKKASREAMLGWAAAIKLKGFCDQVALEYYRSGNVIIYKFDGQIKSSNLERVGVQVNPRDKIPLRYTLINPALVTMARTGFVDAVQYSVTIPSSEVELMLKEFKKNADMFGTLPPEFQDAFNSSKVKHQGNLIIKLNPENIITLYRKKQPYELYALPFLARVLDDIDFKNELRNMDRALARVISRLLVHVKVGKDDLIPSPQSLQELRTLLANPSTSTYLVTDHTVSISQYFPDVAAMLDPKKYDAINQDIQQALGITSAAFGDGGGNYSNNFLGIKVLVERIKDGRSKILEDFLIPESQRVAAAFKIKGDVKPEIQGVDLNDEKEWAKIYSRLYEMGVFSPESTIESIRDGRLPTYNEEVDRQRESLALRNEGLFQTNINRGGNSPAAGRPTGTPNPEQTTLKKVGPVGAEVIDPQIDPLLSQKVGTISDKMASIIKERGVAQRISGKRLMLLNEMARDYLTKFGDTEEKIGEYLKEFLEK